MKYITALSAESYVKGDRVAYKASKDEWYCGTVTSVRNGLVGLLFDDGIKGDPSKPNARTWKRLNSAKLRKKALTDAEVAELTSVAPTTRKASKPSPVKVKHVKIAPVQPTRILPKPIKAPKPAKVSPAKVSDENPKVTTEEAHLLRTLSDYSMFHRAVKSKTDRLTYLQKMWSKANAKFFNMQLPACSVRLQKDMGSSFRRRGAWFPRQRIIKVSPRLFLGNEAHVLSTLVHEMCHQAVSEVDRIANDGNGGHGPHWNAWMKKCGLTPSRYCKYDNENFLTATEKKQIEVKKANVESAKEHVQNVGLRKLYPRKMEYAQYHSPSNNTWYKGLIVCPHDQAGKRWVFVDNPFDVNFRIVPSEWFYALPADELEKLKLSSHAYATAAARILDYKEKKASNRRQNRAMKTYMFGY